MSMALTGLLAVLTMTPARADAKRPDGGPESGVFSALYERRFDPGHRELPGMRLCRDGDRYWLLFTARTPDHNFSSGTFLDVLGIKCTLPWTWLAEVDLKSKLVGAARKVYPPLQRRLRRTHPGRFLPGLLCPRRQARLSQPRRRRGGGLHRAER